MFVSLLKRTRKKFFGFSSNIIHMMRWYCVKDKEYPIYYVYFQEHGRTYPDGITTKSYEEAVTKVLSFHGSLEF